MIILLIVIALVALAVLAWLILSDTSCQVDREVGRVNTAIDDEHLAAKRAMSDAAGQSWRNLSE